MNPNRKSNIAALALSAAVFFTTSLLAKPPAQNYPEYPRNEGVSTPIVVVPTDGGNQQTTPVVNNPPTQQNVVVQNDNPPPYVPPVSTGNTTQNTGYVAGDSTWRNSSNQPTDASAVNAPTSSAGTSNTVCCAGCSVGTRFDSNLVMVEKFLIKSTGALGSDVQYKVRATANNNINNVTLTENLPDGVTFVSADPDVAKGGGNSITWTYPQMQKGEAKEVLVTVRPNREGIFTANTKVCVDPAVCIAFQVGSPRLAIEKVGPTTAELDSNISFDVKVTNVGTATANDVVIVDSLPDGLKGNTTNFTLGNLAPNQSKTVQVPVTAVQQGHWVNTAQANASNADSVSAQAPVDVLLAKIQVQKTGPDRLFINREAPYNITVTNIGTAVLNNVVVTDNLPAGTKLLSVSGQPATQNNSTVVWNIPTLQPGESKTDTLSLTSEQPGTTTNNVTATSGRLSDTAKAQTEWMGPPGVLTEIVDDIDPIRVGGIVTYTIRITNQGAYRDITTQIKVLFGDEITPIETDAPGATIDGKVVTLPDGILNPKGVMTFHIKTKADQKGLHTTRLQFNSSFLPQPINKDESTFVY